MKKSLIALAVAGALTAPMVAQADATLYGSIRVELAQTDVSDKDWQIEDGTSRIGLKGDVDLGIEGVKGVYQFETRLRADEGSFGGTDARLSYVGATGGFGTVLGGRMYTPHWLWTSAVADTVFNDALIGTKREVGLRQPNTLAYISPAMGGFQVAAAAVMGAAANTIVAKDSVLATTVAVGGNNNDESADVLNFAAKYAAGGLQVGVSYMTADKDAVVVDSVGVDYDALGVAAKYSMDAFNVFARYQDEEIDGDDFVTTQQLGGQYTMGATTLTLRWTNVEVDDAVESDEIALGVQQMLGKQGRVFLEYANVDRDAGFDNDVTAALPFASLNGDRIALGYRLDF